MVGRPVVAGFAVGVAGVVKLDIIPLGGEMAVRALSRPVSIACMACHTIPISIVVDGNIIPIIGIVAVRTRPGIMFACAGVAVFTLLVIQVVNGDIIPQIGAVAVRTRPGIMVACTDMAGAAILVICVIEVKIAPVTRIMAIAANAGVVV